MLSNWWTMIKLGQKAILKGRAGLPRSNAEVEAQPRATTVACWPGGSAQVRGHGPSEDRYQHVEGQEDLWQTDPHIKRLLEASKPSDLVQDLVKIHPACPECHFVKTHTVSIQVKLTGHTSLRTQQKLVCKCIYA